MAEDNKIALDIFIEADKASLTLGELEQGFEALNEELRNTKRGTKEFKELSTQIAQTGREVKNIELAFESLDNEQIASELGSVTGAIGDVTAAFILMGGESETMEQMTKSIQKAMAISMGFKGAIEGVSSGMKLYNNLMKTGKIQAIAFGIATKGMALAQKVLNAVMKLNPLGLLILAITAGIAAFFVFKDTIMGFIKDALKPMKAGIDVIIDALQWLGIMASDEAVAEEEAAKKIIKASKEKREELEKLMEVTARKNKAVIAGLDFEIAMRKVLGKETEDVERKKLLTLMNNAKEEKKLTKERLDFMQAELKMRGKLGDITKEQLDEFIEDIKTLNEAYNSSALNIVKTRRDLVLFNAQANQDEIDNERKTLEEKTKIWKDGAKAREEQAAIDKMNSSKERENAKFAMMETITTRKIVSDINTMLDQEDINKLVIHEGVIADIKDVATEAEIVAHKARMERIVLEREAKLEALQIELQATADIGASLLALSSAAANSEIARLGDNEAAKERVRKRQFEREKKLNIAMAAINGAQALLSIFAQYPKFDGGFAMFAAMAASVTTTIASISAIKSAKYQGGGGGIPRTPNLQSASGDASTGSGGASIDSVSNTSTVIGSQQVFVTETDITASQNQVNVIEESATF